MHFDHVCVVTAVSQEACVSYVSTFEVKHMFVSSHGQSSHCAELLRDTLPSVRSINRADDVDNAIAMRRTLCQKCVCVLPLPEASCM